MLVIGDIVTYKGKNDIITNMRFVNDELLVDLESQKSVNISEVKKKEYVYRKLWGRSSVGRARD